MSQSLESRTYEGGKGFLQNISKWVHKKKIDYIGSILIGIGTMAGCGGGGGGDGGTTPIPPKPVYVETVATDTSDASGQAYFYDENKNEDVFINVKENTSKEPVSNAEVRFRDNKNKSKLYHVVDPSGTFVSPLYVFKTNSSHDVDVFFNEDIPKIYRFTANENPENWEALNDSILSIVESNNNCYDETPEGLENKITVLTSGQIKGSNGDVYSYVANQLREITGDVVGWDDAPAYTVCTGVPDPDDPEGRQIWHDIVTIKAKETGIPLPTCTDADGDGYFAQANCGTAVDCDDSLESGYGINPGADEICYDEFDNNCNGIKDEGCVIDRDGDGFDSTADCDDDNPDKYPGAPELCDGYDNQCLGDPGFGEIDEGCAPGGVDKIAYVSRATGHDEIYTINPDGTGNTQITNSGNNNYSIDPSWIENSAFAFTTNMFRTPTSNNPDEIARKDISGGNPVRLTNDDFFDGGPVVSRNGVWIAWHGLRDGGYDSEIYKMRSIDGSGKVKLTNNNEDDLWPSWSPDGDEVVRSRRIGRYQLWVVKSDGSGEDRKISNDNSLNYSHPVWSPNGDKIASEISIDGYRQIIIKNLNDETEEQLTFGNYNHWHPTWNKDGSEIGFFSDKDGNWNIYKTASVPGSIEEKVTDDNNLNSSPDWSK